MTQFQQKVYEKVKKIPRGKVSTYKNIARMIGLPKSARAIGNTLNKNTSRLIPCHRVVRSDGALGGYNRGSKKKKLILLKEGVLVKGEKIDLQKFLWDR